MTEERGPYHAALRRLKFWRDNDKDLLQTMRKNKFPSAERDGYMEDVEARIVEFDNAIELLEVYS